MQMRTERRDEAVFLRARPPDPVRLYVCSGMCGTLHTLSLREWAVLVYVLRLTSLQHYIRLSSMIEDSIIQRTGHSIIHM